MGRSQIGPMHTPGGAAGDVAKQTITTTVRVIGPLTNSYVVEGDQELYVVVGDAEGVGVPGTPVTAINTVAKMADIGRRLPADTELDFEVTDDDTYVAWCRVSADGTNFRCNYTDRGRTALVHFALGLTAVPV